MNQAVDLSSSPTNHGPVSAAERRRPGGRLLLASVLSAAIMTLALGACGNDKKDEGAKPGATQSDAGAVSAGDKAVQIANFEFKPQQATVKAGTKVTWTNEDTAVHGIQDTSPLATPVSKDLAKGDTFSITYDQPGSYSYVCAIHQYMTGSINVVA